MMFTSFQQLKIMVVIFKINERLVIKFTKSE